MRGKRIMKKILTFLAVLMLFCGTVAVFAKEGTIDDERVKMIYWDQPEVQTYWTGVTNKISYDYYAPCVGVPNGGYTCGQRAYQSQYKEHGLAVYVRHGHALYNSWDSMEYIVE